MKHPLLNKYMRYLLYLYLIFQVTPIIAAENGNTRYAVIAFPSSEQKAGVNINGQWYTLQSSTDQPQLFEGSAPFGQTYQYGLFTDQHENDIIEHYQRTLAQGTTNTGNEFFNRSQTLYNVPPLPQVYHPIYPPLFSPFNQSNEIATLLLTCNSTGFAAILANPKDKHDPTRCDSVSYISHDTALKFSMAGLKNSGKSTKEFAKQSYKLSINEFVPKDTDAQYFYGRTTIKLRAHETDVTFMREKLMLDLLGASGAATLGGSFVRLFVNNEPQGLYLMIDDATTSTINNMLHAGDYTTKTGPTYKGNALTVQQEGNLVYKGDDLNLYDDSIYKLEDKGRNYEPKLNKANEKQPLVDFMRQLSTIQPEQATDAQHQGSYSTLLDEKHTLIHLCYSFLSGSWDGVWHQASNYYLNQDPTRNQWTLISYDFDETFGLGAPAHFVNTPWQNFTQPGTQRPLVEGLLNSPYWASEFETMLRTIVKRLFKVSVLEPRLEAWRLMLRDDVIFDLGLNRSSPGIQTTWTPWNFETNINATDGQNIGVLEWIRIRSSSLQQQLQFTEEDDLPPLGPYTDGKQWDQDRDGVKPAKDKSASGAARHVKSLNSIVLALVIIGQFLVV
ncbi:coth protein-domain-containing protein [Halteromyces radiatus]|uniref:coth protein-domain-containing protein n=1 Tax=Halteromyces radiatus TaxID=101107 RepID=UPI00221F694A|nr:coth protein-domain-containing protein [Halteromyces radiatus]KAI8093162.1 coth protein-domain-containing protein [Halteromyces radiatus]